MKLKKLPLSLAIIQFLIVLSQIIKTADFFNKLVVLKTPLEVLLITASPILIHTVAVVVFIWISMKNFKDNKTYKLALTTLFFFPFFYELIAVNYILFLIIR